MNTPGGGVKPPGMGQDARGSYWRARLILGVET